MPSPPKQHYSLRGRLLLLIIGSSSLLWLASLSIMAAIAWKETNDVFDDALEESGYLIMSATTDWNERGMLAEGRPGNGQARKVDMQYQIVVDGKVLQRTHGSPLTPFVTSYVQKSGFHNAKFGEKSWRVFVAKGSDQRISVQVGQDDNKRLDILRELAEHLVLPVVMLLSVLVMTSRFCIGRAIKPIDTTTKAITEKSRDDLSLVAVEHQIAELAPIVDALNGVLSRLDAALQAERRFTADAAHELRTPLAALHVNVQLLQRQYPTLASSFQQLRDDIDRSTKLVDSLLTLARLDPMSSGNLVRGVVEIAPLLSEIAKLHLATARQRGIAIRTRCMLDHMCINPDLLHIVLRNLVDNALLYCPPNSTIEIRATWQNGIARLAVCDNGPGVKPDDMVRLTERFFRVLGSGQGGSGLGLSIVRRIAQLHGAVLHFGHGIDERGLGVYIDFPTDSAGDVYGSVF
jgi:two-component system sensor histidine kinase QseC